MRLHLLQPNENLTGKLSSKTEEKLKNYQQNKKMQEILFFSAILVTKTALYSSYNKNKNKK